MLTLLLLSLACGPEPVSAPPVDLHPCQSNDTEGCVLSVLEDPGHAHVPEDAEFWDQVEYWCDVTTSSPCGEKTPHCRRRKADACLALAKTGRGDLRGLAEKAALLGNAEGYLLSATMLWVEGAPFRDLRTAYKQLRRACKSGKTKACELQAQFEAEIDLEARAQAELQSATAACEQGDCEALYFVYEYGIGTEHNRRRAMEIAEAGCLDGNAELCFQFGTTYAYGGSSEKNEARAREMLALGCEADHAKACRWYGDMLRMGMGGEEDLEAAKAPLKKGCDLGNGDACNLYGALF